MTCVKRPKFGLFLDRYINIISGENRTEEANLLQNKFRLFIIRDQILLTLYRDLLFLIYFFSYLYFFKCLYLLFALFNKMDIVG